jgi:hypothetical protein
MHPAQPEPFKPPLPRNSHHRVQRLHSLALDALERGTAFERENTAEEAFWKAQFEAAMRRLAGIKRTP